MIELLTYGVSLGFTLAVSVLIIIYLRSKFKEKCSVEDLKSVNNSEVVKLMESVNNVDLTPSLSVTEKWKESLPSKAKRLKNRNKRKRK